MQQDEKLMRQLLEVFRDEAQEHLQNAGRMLVELEKQGMGHADSPELLAETFRAIHSLKGAARVVNLNPVADTSHRMESVLNAARNGEITLTSEHFDLLLKTLDELERLVAAGLAGEAAEDLSDLHGHLDAAIELRALASDPGPAEPELALPAEPPVVAHPTRPPEDGGSEGPSRPEGTTMVDETIRVAAAKLDALLAQTGELLTAKIGVDQRARELRGLASLTREQEEDWRRLRDDLARSTEFRTIDVLHRIETRIDGIAELSDHISAVAHDLAQDRQRIGLVTTDLQDEIRRLRMLPVSMLFDTVPRLVRDLARRQDKKVDLVSSGGEIEVDKRILEGIKDPLLHLLNNAVDHGLETAAERAEAGKGETGTIMLQARMRGSDLVVKINDDGRGIDIHKVRDTAIARGLIRKEEAERVVSKDQINLIFRSGLSTKDEVTDLSGRGVGLDVVRENVERLGGRLEVASEVGKGTTFRMIVPISVATAEGLLLDAGGQTFALPMTAASRILRVPRRDVQELEGKPAVVVDGDPVALAYLSDLLELERRPLPDDADMSVVLMASATRRVGFVVDALLGHQEMVVKSLGAQLARVRNVVGATVLGSGEVVVVLNPLDLLRSATHDRRATTSIRTASWDVVAEAPTRKTVLVADDSITTRNLERMTLESAGYEVRTAADGQQAWRLLQGGDYDLVITDLNMPQMNGLELIRRIKSDTRLGSTPVILLTSMGSIEDIERGLEVGADAYVVKSAFERESILATVRELI